MLLQRIATAAVGVPIIIAVIIVGGATYVAVVALILAITAIEFFNALSDQPSDTADATFFGRLTHVFLNQRPIAYIGAGAVALLAVAADNGFDEWTGAFVAAIAVSFVYLILRGDPKEGMQDWMRSIAAVAYIGFLGSHLVLLRDVPDGKEWVLLAVFATFIADTFAYFVGRTVGRTRITPRISPNKTVEGTLAGVASGVATVLILNWALGLDVDIEKILPLALLLPIAAFFGDLAESMIKRGVGIKDTSDFVPGHGGFLDRIDAVLFTTPLVYYWLIWVIL
ncbi:MAG: CDP-archaeol synthase [Chloroflexi bacterium]|nr:CDP-archaeol synthase [Chloroflexota bacterium]